MGNIYTMCWFEKSMNTARYLGSGGGATVGGYIVSPSTDKMHDEKVEAGRQ